MKLFSDRPRGFRPGSRPAPLQFIWCAGGGAVLPHRYSPGSSTAAKNMTHSRSQLAHLLDTYLLDTQQRKCRRYAGRRSTAAPRTRVSFLIWLSYMTVLKETATALGAPRW